MNAIGSIFLKGFAVVFPLLVTIYIFVWLFVGVENAMAVVLPESMGHKGIGVALVLVLVFLIGLSVQLYIGKYIFNIVERIFMRIPVVKTIYGSVKDFIDYFSSNTTSKVNQTVIVTLGDPPVRLIGLVTRESFEGLPEGIGEEGMVAVYLPMSYQIGGYTLMLPRDRVQPVDMNTEDTLRFVLTAGMTVKREGAQR